MVSQTDKSRTGQLSYCCSICGRKFKEASHFTKHKRGALCKKLVQRAAKKSDKRKANLKKDLIERKKKNIASLKPYQCNVCGAKFYDRGNVELHLERQHQTNKHLWVEIYKYSGSNCNDCDKWFADEKSLKDHERQHMVNYLQGSTSQTVNDRVLENNALINNAYYTGPDPNLAAYSTPQDHIQPPPLLPMPSTSLHLPHSLPLNSQTFSNQNNCQVSSNGNQLIPLQPLSVNPHVPTVNNNTCPINDNIIPSAQQNSTCNIATTSNNHQTNSNNILNVPSTDEDRLGKISMYDKSKSSINAKACVCGDCGCKFIDVLNLELHIQRKHPNSKILQTVNLGGGTVLYKTNNTNRNINSFMMEHDPNKSNKNPQSYDCLLCGYRTTGLNSILPHLQIVHNTTSSNFIHVIETLEMKRGTKGCKLGKKIKSEPVLKEEITHTCDSCNSGFSSKAELVRHRIKDKQFMCGVCYFSSCSENIVSTHMTNHNNTSNASGTACLPQSIGMNSINNVDTTQFNISSDGILCWVCGIMTPSIAALDDHLNTHGSTMVECRLCSKSSDSLSSISSHLVVQHPQQQISLTFVLTPLNSPPMIHNLVVSSEGAINVANIYNNHELTSVNENNDGNTESAIICANDCVEKVPKEKVVMNVDSQSSDLEQKVKLRLPPSYACSVCGTCLTGPSQLEEHLQLHQDSSNGHSENITSELINSNLAASSLKRVDGSIEFRCEECGFWRAESDPVMRHINAVHMSGNMLHSIRLPSGSIQVYPIHVVTPISSLASE